MDRLGGKSTDPPIRQAAAAETPCAVCRALCPVERVSPNEPDMAERLPCMARGVGCSCSGILRSSWFGGLVVDHHLKLLVGVPVPWF